MKLPVIIALFAVSLGLSFAAGGYFAPAFLREKSFLPASAPTQAITSMPGMPAGQRGVMTGGTTPDQIDPEKALSQAQQMPEGQARTQALSAAISQMAQKDPVKAMALAQQMPAGQVRNGAILGVIMQMAQSDPEKALGEAKQMPPGQMREQALANVVAQMAQKDPAAAFALSQTMKARRGATAFSASSRRGRTRI